MKGQSAMVTSNIGVFHVLHTHTHHYLHSTPLSSHTHTSLTVHYLDRTYFCDFLFPPRTHLQHTAPHLLHFHSPVHHRSAMTMTRICSLNRHSQTSLVGTSVDLWVKATKRCLRYKISTKAKRRIPGCWLVNSVPTFEKHNTVTYFHTKWNV